MLLALERWGVRGVDRRGHRLEGGNCAAFVPPLRDGVAVSALSGCRRLRRFSTPMYTHIICGIQWEINGLYWTHLIWYLAVCRSLTVSCWTFLDNDRADSRSSY